MIRRIKSLYRTMADPRTPWYVKLVPIAIILYAIFPFDIAPDFIPYAGWIDDIIIIPAGLWLFAKLVPNAVLKDTISETQQSIESVKRWILWGGLALVGIIILVLVFIAFAIFYL